MNEEVANGAANTAQQNPEAIPAIVIIAILAVIVISWWKIFTKAGKPGWAALIPIYNVIVLLEICRRPIWWIFLFFIPIVNVVIGVIVTVDLAMSFGKGILFMFGIIIFPVIFYAILAFDSSKYIAGPQEEFETT